MYKSLDNSHLYILTLNLNQHPMNVKFGDLFLNAAYHHANHFGRAHNEHTKQPVRKAIPLPLVLSVKELTAFPGVSLHENQRVVG